MQQNDICKNMKTNDIIDFFEKALKSKSVCHETLLWYVYSALLKAKPNNPEDSKLKAYF